MRSQTANDSRGRAARRWFIGIMKIARTITNQFKDFRLLEVGKTTRHPERRGPYMVVQTGSAPGDPEFRECTFALTHKGTWMHCYVFFLLPRPLRRKIAVFESVPEVMNLAGGLTGDPVVETIESLQHLLRDAGFNPLADDPASEALMQDLRTRHPQALKSKEAAT